MAATTVSPEEVQQVAELYQAEVPYAEIEARTGLSQGQISWRVRLAGVKRSASHSRFLQARNQTHPDVERQGPFGMLLQQLREARMRSRNSLAREVGIDTSYLTRAERGDRDPPRQYIVEAIARALRLDTEERDQLLVSAGYKPAVLNGSGWHPALHDLAVVLNDYRIPQEDRDELAQTVRAITRRWRP